VTLPHENVDFVFPKYSANPVLLPMRVRIFYRVTYGDDDLVAMFPTQVNGYYETVLNATRNFQFTTDTVDARWGAEPEWKLFDREGALINSYTGINTAITSQYEEFYISVNVPVLGGSGNASVNHYNIDNFLLENGYGVEIATISDYPSGSDLAERMASEGSFWHWEKSDSMGRGTYDNAEHYLASARFSRTILFKIFSDQCLDLMANGTLNLTYFDPIAGSTCATGYKANLTIGLVDLTLSSDGLVVLRDDYISPLPSATVKIGNPSDQPIDNITYSLKMKRYAIRTKDTSTSVIDTWDPLVIIPGDGIDMGEDCVFSITNSVSAGASVSGSFEISYSEISEFANKCGYTLPEGKSIASGIFIFELEMSYGSTTKTTELAFRLGYKHCISMRTENLHGILQDPSSKKWSGIKDVDLTITEVNDVTLSKIGSLNSLFAVMSSLIYVSPVSKTIVSYGVSNWGSYGSIGSYGVMSGTTIKRVILAGIDGKTWASADYANLQTGSAYLSIRLADNYSSFLTVQNTERIIDIVAPPVFEIITTPDGSEIDDISEAEFGEQG